MVVGVGLVAAQRSSTPSSSKHVEPARYGVEVEVLDGTGAAIPNADVQLKGPGEQEEAVGNVSDASGRLRFNSLLPGRYAFWARAKGFNGYWRVSDVPTQGVVRMTLSPMTLVVDPSCYDCGVETITSSLNDLIPLPADASPAVAPTSASPRRNPLVRFFSGIGHKLGL
jgi:hypothetical protein